MFQMSTEQDLESHIYQHVPEKVLKKMYELVHDMQRLQKLPSNASWKGSSGLNPLRAFITKYLKPQDGDMITRYMETIIKMAKERGDIEETHLHPMSGANSIHANPYLVNL